jgi:hypothetical protein
MRIQAEYKLNITWHEGDDKHVLQIGPARFDRLLMQIARACRSGQISQRDCVGISEGLRRLMRRQLRLRIERFSTGGKSVELIEQQDTLAALLRSRGLRSYQV